MKKYPFLISLLLAALTGCTAVNAPDIQQHSNANNGDGLMVVDCLLPAQIRKLGQLGVFATARRPTKSTASECEIRGGEYVSYDRANYATALKVWLPKAQAGEAEAQAYVGEIYEKGLGLMPNYNVAVEWYRKAAEQGNSRAQINLGYLYERGLGVKKDIAAAMSWYEKSSGLQKVNLPYAATIETSNDNQLSKEIKFLKTELKNSRNESKNLAAQLETIQQKLSQEQADIVTSSDTLAETKQLLKNATQQANQSEISRLQNIINSKEQALKNQQQNVAQLKQQYQNKIENLTVKLEETEKRATQFADDLKRQKSSASEAELKVLDAQAKLANTEKRLINLKRMAQDESELIANEKINQAKLADYKGLGHQAQLKNTLSALKRAEQEKIQQQDWIAKLTEENVIYKQSIDNLKVQISKGVASTSELEKLNKELENERIAAQQSRQELAEKQDNLLKTEKKLLELERNSQELLKIQESEKLASEKKSAIILSQKTQQHEEAVARFKKSEQKLAEQEKLISQLESEKKAYEQRIVQLQKEAGRQKLANNPTIEMIDPPVVLVRGTPTVTLRSLIKKRDIFGKVTASSDLMSFMVNDQKNTVDDQGLFKASVKLTDMETPVTLVAIDNNGLRSSLDFILSLGSAVERSQKTIDLLPKVKVNQTWRSLDFGQYYALVIGNNKYQKIPSLDTPINDAVAVEKILKEKYGFKTKLLKNSSRYQILSELNQLRAKLSEKDNLLIYYAGHGELDKVNMRGHWLPVDADADNTANWISTVAITDVLNTMTVKHIMVVSDSCYSGAMTRSSLARIEAGSDPQKKSQWLKAMLKARSRTVLTSGGLKPVMDGGGGQHSVFANAFIKALSGNDTLLEGQSLYRKVSAGIVAIAADYGIEQVPEYAPIRHAGHESGEFFFVPQNI